MTMPETTQSDLVERLRTTKLLSQRNQMELQREAAAEITRLRADSDRLQKIESQIDGGRFEEWPTETFVGQLRMQSRDSLDPEYSQFMAATATHLGLLSGVCDAQQEIAESAKEDAARLRAHCEAMSRALETAERQITAAFGIIHPGNDDLLEGSLESIRRPLAAYRGESAS